ncbi:MAG: IgGFc-binding protein, partial [Myxococcota bacterium]
MPSNTPLVGVDAARIPIKVSAVARQRTSPEEEDPVQEHGDGSPPSGPCDAGELRCVHRSAWVCEAGVWRLGSCPGQAVCWDGVCREPWCTPGTSWCTRSDALAVCNPHGVSVESYACPEGTVCEGGSCEPLCEPGRTRCVGDEVQECQPDGRTFAVVDSCDPEQGRTCIDGACQGGCAAYRAKGQSIGCEFWGVDAPNRFGLHNRFAFVVGNVDPEAMAHVKVESSDGQLLAESAVAPGQMAALHLPHPRMTNVSESGVTDFGLRIVSDAPINAYQFNPLERYDDDNAQLAVASTDASLLLNGSGLGTEHLVLSYPQWSHYGSFVTIVSAEDHNLVTVRPTADTASGLNVPALVAGATWNVTLERGQVLTLLTNREGSDLTGTEVLSSAPVAVYGGVDCARIPIESDFCDHIEEVSLPVSVWGRVYVGARFGQRGLARD